MPDHSLLRTGQDSLPDALLDFPQFSDLPVPAARASAEGARHSSAAQVAHPKLSGLPGLEPIYRSAPPREVPTLACSPPDGGGELRAHARSTPEQGSAHSGTHKSSSRVSALGGSLRGESAAETTLHLRIFSEILFSAGMNDLTQIQRLLKQVRCRSATGRRHHR